jgi:DNA polymerase-3 subunit gamma/tau
VVIAENAFLPERGFYDRIALTCPDGRGGVFVRVSLYRKYRPQIFSDIVEQKAATDLLRISFTEGRLGQAYLFSGPRGCGKTTAARILAKVVNCRKPKDGEPCCECESCRAVSAGEHLDVMEIDGASNRGIDQIRELKSHVGLSPFMGGSKVYILDEVHMLTTEAFNALLKTLEEPPSFALFIFATTEPNKVPATIRSRCQHIPFHRITAEGIAAQLRNVASMEGFEADDSALWEVARNADGALRDALSLAEQALALGNGRLSAEAVNGLLGGGGRMEMERFASLLRTSPADASSALKELLGRGVSPERFLDALFPLFRDMWVYSLWGEASFSGLTLSSDEKKFLESEVPGWDSGTLGRLVAVCASLFPRARYGLRSDVFAGLLIFGLLGAIKGEDIRAVTPAMPEISEAKEAKWTKDAGVSAGVPPKRAAPVLVPQKAPVPMRIHETAPSGGLRGEWADRFGSLWETDLSLCAAIIDAGLFVKDGELIIDSSETSPISRAVLESARAKSAIGRAFGLKEGSAYPQQLSEDEAHQRQDVPQSARPLVSPGAMSVEEISSFLGADLLMAKPRSGTDLDDSDLDMEPHEA